MDLEQIKELIAELEKSSLAKINIRQKDFELSLEKVMASTSSPVAVTAAAPQAAPQQIAVEPVKQEKPGDFITSPMVGTFYSSPGPDQPKFVKVGDKVAKGSVVCIIEALQ